MVFEEAVEFFRKKYGNHSKAADALGWEVRKYRDVRNSRNKDSDARRLLIALAEVMSLDGDQ